MESTNVKVISREIIRPSSETPSHLKKLKLSYLDQLAPPELYVPIIFLYEADESRGLTRSNHVRVSRRLKQSLSSTLTSFYPLAGRVRDNFVVDCNDAGCEFIEAKVDARLVDVVQDPNLDNLARYLPDTTHGSVAGAAIVIVKITFFECGGISIGVCVSHKVADCKSIMWFIDAWAGACRGEAETSSQINFDLASYFEARDFPPFDFAPLLESNQKRVTRRVFFEKEKLAALKQAVTSPSGSSVTDPTRVEVASAFIWKSFLEVAKANNSEGEKEFSALHVVNLRGRTNPPQVPENVFGNCLMSTLTTTQYHQGDEELHDLVGKLRRAIRTINDDYVTRARAGNNYLNDLFNMVTRLLKGDLEVCNFSSWCRFPVYEVDYGWGKPICFFTTMSCVTNTTILLSSRSGDGIEALVTMPQEYIERLDAQIKLLSTTTTTVINL